MQPAIIAAIKQLLPVAGSEVPQVKPRKSKCKQEPKKCPPQPLMIDITPVDCSTPEGAARVATANVANEAEQIVGFHAERITAGESRVITSLLEKSTAPPGGSSGKHLSGFSPNTISLLCTVPIPGQ